MIFELLSIAFAAVAGATAVIAFVYRRGRAAGIDKACGKRIEKKIDKMQAEGDKIHNELKTEIHEIHSKIDKMSGSFETFKELIGRKL